MICIFCFKPVEIIDCYEGDSMRSRLERGETLPKYSAHAKCNRVTCIRGISSPQPERDGDDGSQNRLFITGTMLHLGGYRLKAQKR